ncbi:MAG: hypothetical protein U0R19_13070 [Bryobacteraceae bacterium]
MDHETTNGVEQTTRHPVPAKADDRGVKRLRQSAPANESGHEVAEGNPDAEPDSDEPQDIRTAKPRKTRVVDAVDGWRDCQRQDEERREQGALLAGVDDGLG